ncbi:Hypothetical predicted protein [Mytilus galloprovincialis]|uniref:Uncharacterized protein n=1 Tax=Mytilus galloprovincialis TaxID=29158 RepID=A0A8B6FMX9_MYTGA|nr:Hypothetical predicted protein [Mytilus galloprovincialis]
MAAFMAVLEQEMMKERRPRIFRDRNNPIDYMADIELIERYRLPRIKILEVVDLIRKDTSIESPTSRSHAIPAILQQQPLEKVLAEVRKELMEVKGDVNRRRHKAG